MAFQRKPGCFPKHSEKQRSAHPHHPRVPQPPLLDPIWSPSSTRHPKAAVAAALCSGFVLYLHSSYLGREALGPWDSAYCLIKQDGRIINVAEPAGFSKQFMSYHGSSLALSPMTSSWRAWIKQEARTHLNARQIVTSKTHPRPYFLHFVQHMSNHSTKKSPVIRTDNQCTETHLDTKKFTIPLFFFCYHQAISDGCLHLKNCRSLAEGLPGLHREAALALGTVDTEWLPWLSVLRIRFHFTHWQAPDPHSRKDLRKYLTFMVIIHRS